MHLPISISIVLRFLVLVPSAVGDWVEIPFLQPSSTSTTPKTTIIRKTVNHPAFSDGGSSFMSQVLSPIGHSQQEEDDPSSTSEESEVNEESSHQSLKDFQDFEDNKDVLMHHFHRPPQESAAIPFVVQQPPVKISNLVDFEAFSQSSASTERSPISSVAEPGKYSHFEKRFYEFPRSNVSNKLGWSPPPVRNEYQFVTANRNPFSSYVAEHQPAPAPQNVPSRYQEESIEYGNTENPPLSFTQRPESPPTQIRPFKASSTLTVVDDRIEIPADDGGSSEENTSSETSEEKDHNASGSSINSSEKPPKKDSFHDFDDYDAEEDDETQQQQQYRNVSGNNGWRRRPLPGRVRIVKVIPPIRRFRRPPGTPTTTLGGEGGLSGFLSFLKTMQDSFMKRTAKNIGDKIKILQDLKDQLLVSIENRMTNLWNNPGAFKQDVVREERRRRVKRGGGGWMEHSGSGHGGMDFPSAEAALLTISFLTFAVFLIKLVLQVINTIKSKHYTYNTMAGLNGMINSGTLKIVSRGKRSEPDKMWNHDLDILSAINSYKFS